PYHCELIDLSGRQLNRVLLMSPIVEVLGIIALNDQALIGRSFLRQYHWNTAGWNHKIDSSFVESVADQVGRYVVQGEVDLHILEAHVVALDKTFDGEIFPLILDHAILF